jgi:hypothetical protein
MFDEIYKIIIHHYPWIGLMIAIVVAVIIGTYKTTKLIFRFKKTEEDCKGVKTELTRIETSVEGVKESVNVMNSSLMNLIMYLKTKDKSLDTSLLFIIRSPIQLTEFGHHLLDDIGGKVAIDNNIEELLSKMETQDFKSGLDVQNYASLLIMTAFNNDEIFTSVKNYMFANPVYRYNDGEKILQCQLDMTTVNTVLGIYLRDKYFEKHPELNT